MRLERLALTKRIDEALTRDRARRDPAGEDLAGRCLQAAMAMRQVDRLEHAVEQLLQVDQIDDDLAGKPANEPRGEHTVERFDLAIGLGIARLDPDAVGPEVGEAGAERVRVEDRRAIGVHPPG